ncbi:MAG: DUF417 family protein [Hyphomicrobiales bacterium]
MNNRITKIGYALGVLGTAIILIWIGIFKFTNVEALAIKPLVTNHPAMSWLYSIFSVQWVSNIFGIVEIIIGIALLLSFWSRKAGLIGGILSTLTFIATFSFLFTTPDMITYKEGIPVIDFFILKDLTLLAFSIMVWGRSTR